MDNPTFAKGRCPHCGSDIDIPVVEWEQVPPKNGSTFFMPKFDLENIVGCSCDNTETTTYDFEITDFVEDV